MKGNQNTGVPHRCKVKMNVMWKNTLACHRGSLELKLTFFPKKIVSYLPSYMNVCSAKQVDYLGTTSIGK